MSELLLTLSPCALLTALNVEHEEHRKDSALAFMTVRSRIFVFLAYGSESPLRLVV